MSSHQPTHPPERYNWAIRKMRFDQLIAKGVDPEKAEKEALRYMKAQATNVSEGEE